MGSRTKQGDRFTVHPFADTFPLLTGSARAELREDIRKHGIREPIVLWLDNREVAESGDINRSAGEGDWYLVDGRNRLEIADELGIDPPIKRVEAYRLVSRLGRKPTANATRWEASIPDVEALILSLNVHRRHLTAAQKQKAIKVYAALNPNASDRKIARAVGVSHPTVAKTRNGDQNGKTFQNDRSPIERAAQVVSDNPALSNRAAAKIADVSLGTISKARKQLGHPPRPKGRPLKRPASAPITDVTKATQALTRLLDQFDKPTLQTAWANLGLNIKRKAT